MQIDRWQHVQDLYFRALEMPELHRTPFLENACRDDPRMRQEVESLLECEDKIGEFLDPMPVEVLEEMVGKDASTEDLDEADDIIGAIIDSRYVVTQRVGSGGMGDVYRADHRLMGTPVAIKRLNRRFRDREEHRQRFLDEARRAIALDHENITRVKDVVEEADEVFVVMEFIDGQTLKTHRDPPPSLQEFLDVAIQCASALVAAHERGIAHLDIKPGNIMLTPSGRVKICDFGVARQITPSAKAAGNDEKSRWTFGGTPAYMAPEVLESNHFDVRADVFSMGLVFYELLSGKNPFWCDDVRTTTNKILKDVAPPVQRDGKRLPVRLVRLIDRMLSKDPGHRVRAAETLHELRAIQRRHNLVRDVRRAPSELIPLVRKKPAATLSLVITTLAIAAALMYFRPLSMLGLNALPDRKAVAVLPCRVQGNATEAQMERARGTAEFVALRLSELTSFPGLRISPPAYIREEQINSMEEARRILGATLVVDCALTFTNNQVTFTHSLIGTADDPRDNEVLRQGKSLVSSSDDRTFYEEKIPQVVAATLEVQLAPSREPGTSSEEAFNFYKQGLGVLSDFDDARSLDQAINLFGQAVEEDSTYAAAYSALGQAYAYKFDRTQNREFLRLSLENCQKAETNAPDSSDTQVCLGRVYWKMGLLPLAEQAFSQAIKYSATNDEAQRLLGRVYEAESRFDLAEKHYLEAIDIRGDWQSHSWIAGFYAHARHDYKKAEEHYNLALGLSPGGKNARVLYSLGGVHGMAGDYAGAIEPLKESDRLVPSQPKTLSNLGLAYLMAGKIDLAIPEFEKAALLVEQEGGDHAAVGNLARAYWANGQKDKARDTYKRAISIAEEQLKSDPDNPAIHILLARYYAALQNSQKAKESIDRALHHTTRGKPTDPHYLLIAATAYALLGEKSLAMDHIQFAKNFDKNNDYGRTEIQAEPELNVLKDEPRYKMLISTLK